MNLKNYYGHFFSLLSVVSFYFSLVIEDSRLSLPAFIVGVISFAVYITKYHKRRTPLKGLPFKINPQVSKYLRIYLAQEGVSYLNSETGESIFIAFNQRDKRFILYVLSWIGVAALEKYGFVIPYLGYGTTAIYLVCDLFFQFSAWHLVENQFHQNHDSLEFHQRFSTVAMVNLFILVLYVGLLINLI